MELRIRCAAHNQVLKIFSSYGSFDVTTVDVEPCPECAAEQSVHPTGLTPRQKEEVEQMIESAIIRASA